MCVVYDGVLIFVVVEKCGLGCRDSRDKGARTRRRTKETVVSLFVLCVDIVVIY